MKVKRVTGGFLPTLCTTHAFKTHRRQSECYISCSDSSSSHLLSLPLVFLWHAFISLSPGSLPPTCLRLFSLWFPPLYFFFLCIFSLYPRSPTIFVLSLPFIYFPLILCSRHPLFPPSLPPTFPQCQLLSLWQRKWPIRAHFTVPASPSLPYFFRSFPLFPSLPPPTPLLRLLSSHLPCFPTTFISSLPGDKMCRFTGDRRLSNGVSCAAWLIMRDTANPGCLWMYHMSWWTHTCTGPLTQANTTSHAYSFSPKRRRRRRQTRHVYVCQSKPVEYDLHDISIFYPAVYYFALWPLHSLPLYWLSFCWVQKEDSYVFFPSQLGADLRLIGTIQYNLFSVCFDVLFMSVYVCAPSSQVLICVHDEWIGGELHGASELGISETQALHLRHAWSGVSVSD